LYVQLLPIPAQALLVADAIGLALFALSGAQLAEAARLSPIIVVLMGTMTGVAGGVMRDICSNQIPLLLRQDIYASAAIAGIALYLALKGLAVLLHEVAGLLQHHGFGQPRIGPQACITGGPSTGSCAPIAIRLRPVQRSRQKSRAWRETAAPSASGNSGTMGGKARSAARWPPSGNGAL
jgi:hypothetical protein